MQRDNASNNTLKKSKKNDTADTGITFHKVRREKNLSRAAAQRRVGESFDFLQDVLNIKYTLEEGWTSGTPP